MIAVVYASALAAVAFMEPAAAAVRDRLVNRQLVAPRLLIYELTNTALKKVRRHPGRAGVVRSGLARVFAADFAIYWSDVEPVEVLGVAERSGLSAYDASYLWLAVYLDADLVTLDGVLEAAWGKHRH